MQLNVSIGKIGSAISLGEVEALPAASVAYLLQYGANQCLNDTHASVKRSDFSSEGEFKDAVYLKVENRAEQLRSGAVPGTRTPSAATAAVRKLQAAIGSGGVTDDQILAFAAFLESQKTAAESTEVAA